MAMNWLKMLCIAIGLLSLNEAAIAQSLAKDKECYDRLVKEGIAFMKSKDFGKAINQFWVAYNCNYEPGNDSLQLLINTAVRKLEVAKETAEKNEIRAINSERKTLKAIEQTLQEKQAKEEALLKAQQSGKKAEASLLASLSSIALQQGNLDKAVAAAYASICMSEAEMQSSAWLAFGAAVASKPLQLSLPQNANISELHVLPYGKKCLAVAGESVFLVTQSGESILELKLNHGAIKRAVVAPDGRRFATWEDNYLQVWDDQGSLLKEMPAFASEIMDVCISKDGQKLLACTRNGMVILENIVGTEQKVLIAKGACVYDIQFSSTGNLVLARFADGLIRTWDSSGSPLGTMGVGDIYAHYATFSTNERDVITASANGKVKRWQTNGNLQDEIIEHKSPVKEVWCSTNEKSIISRAGNSIGIFINGKNLPLISLDVNINGIAINKGEDRIFTFLSNNSIRLYDMNGVVLWEIKNLDAPCEAAQFSPIDNSIILTLQNQAALLLDAEGRTLMETNSSIPARFTSDGAYIITNSSDAKNLILTPHPYHEFDKYKNNEALLGNTINSLITEYGLEYISQILK